MPSASRGSGPQVHEAGLECGSTGAHGVRVVVARSRRVWGYRSVRTRAPRPRQIRAQPANLVFFSPEWLSPSPWIRLPRACDKGHQLHWCIRTLIDSRRRENWNERTCRNDQMEEGISIGYFGGKIGC